MRTLLGFINSAALLAAIVAYCVAKLRLLNRLNVGRRRQWRESARSEK